MRLKFTKMHGCGNDYIYINCFDRTVENPNALSFKLSNRRFGIGGDGVILVCPSQCADAKMRMFNADGSEGRMCGNGIRCVGKFLYDNNLVDVSRDTVTVETLSGIKTLRVFKENGVVTHLKVDMGNYILKQSEIPVNVPDAPEDRVINHPVNINGNEYRINCVSMGSPHCVVFVDNTDEIDIDKIGPEFENNPLFPERINTEFIQVISEDKIKMRVWERGSGETAACGTGACAAVATCVENKLCKKNQDITVKLNGGELVICCTDDTVFMTGEATKVFQGEIEV